MVVVVDGAGERRTAIVGLKGCTLRLLARIWGKKGSIVLGNIDSEVTWGREEGKSW